MRRPHNSGTNDDDLKRKLSASAIRRLLGLARPYAKSLILAAALAGLSTLTSLVVPWFVRDAANRLANQRAVSDLDRDASLIFAIVIASGVLNYVQFILSARIGNRVVNDLRVRLFSHLQRLPVAYFDRHRSGDLTSYLSNDVGQLQSVLTNDLARFFPNLLGLAGGLTIALILNWRLTLVMFAVLAAGLAFFIFCGIRLKQLNRQTLDALAESMGGMSEALVNIRLVKAFDRETHEESRVSSALGRLYSLAMRAAKLEGVMVTVGGSAAFIMMVGLLWFGARGVISGAFQVGDVVGFIVVLTVIISPMTSLAVVYTSLQRGTGAAERIFAILDEPAEPEDAPGALAFPAGQGHVTFRSIDFGYAADLPVLQDLDLDLIPGGVTALVGPSGSGKSTVASLLFRFYEVQKGQIEIDGVSIGSIQRHALRANVGIVPQEPILFQGSLLENIRYGRLDATDAEVECAATMANVAEFAEKLPERYQTPIGERGVTLSGGQRQRVAIARAILKDPRILVLDEATSALDNRSEALVREALDRLMSGRTTLVIAHRLSTIQNADRIAVMGDGRILENGTHDDLMRNNGAYAELIRAGERNAVVLEG
jgi:subfamily B ATP-binding cassette protein MsbA